METKDRPALRRMETKEKTLCCFTLATRSALCYSALAPRSAAEMPKELVPHLLAQHSEVATLKELLSYLLSGTAVETDPLRLDSTAAWACPCRQAQQTMMY